MQLAKYHSRFLLVLLSLILIQFYSCSEKSKIQNPRSTILDDAGIEVSLDSIPKRIISLAPNITEALFAIGADSQLVGVTDFCDFPPEAKTKTKTGSYLSPDYETIASLKPDLIIINVENVSNPTYQALKNLGLKLYLSNAKNLDGIMKMIKNFGEITGRKNSSDSVIKALNNERNKLLQIHSDTLNSLILISINPLMTTNGKTFINEILKFSGIKNVYLDEDIDYPSVSFEDAVKKNPANIIFPTDTNDINKSQKFIDEIKRQLKNTDAVKNNRIILVDENIMYRPGPRIFDAAKNLRKKTYSMNNEQ